ncbi:MAG: WYL domain-containing protein [Pseudonocardiales bacterium]|nr:WYL domain-containing protein [Actinomycetota bacterium]PZS18318.1 MAG: WYL domain-containing protein [Pseudonocardiales bacterium]
MPAAARAERLVNLVLCLLSSRQYLPAERIRRTVPGYADAASDEAFFRMFERDKAELRELGVPLETGRIPGFEAGEGYRIARRDYELPDIDLEADEAAAVALAARLWDSSQLAGAAHGALVKLRAAGVEVDTELSAVVQPRVRATEPALTPLISAVQAGQVVTFPHRRHPAEQPIGRTLEPWGVVSWRGRWYVVGHDRDRDATRCFRVSRIAGPVRAIGAPGAVQRPPGVDLLKIVAGSAEPPAAAHTVRLWLADGRAYGLRQRATVLARMTLEDVAGDVVTVELPGYDVAARWIAGLGPDAVVLEPAELATAVRARLSAAAGSVG